MRDKVVYGGAWVFALRIAGRAVTMIATLVLARVLAPSDFGVVAIATLAISFLDTVSQTGYAVALIQKRHGIQDFLDTVWLVSFVRGVVLYGALYLAAPWVAAFFANSAAVEILRALAISFVLQGACNVGMVYLSKDLEFRKIFVYELTATAVNAVAAIGLAIVLRSAWALVWGTLAGNAASLVLSYVLHPFRPRLRLDLAKARELSHFGRWVAGSSVLLFFINKGDNAYVAKMLGDAALGIYTVAFSIANLPTTEITRVVSQVMFPAYAKLRDDPRRLREGYRRSLQAIVFLSAPMAGAIFLFAADFLSLFLGEKWLPIVVVTRILCVGGLIRSVSATTGPLFQAVGRPELVTALVAARLLVMGGLIYPLGRSAGLPGVGAAVVLSAAVIDPVAIAIAARLSGNRLRDIARAVALPVLNTVLTGGAVIGMAALLPGVNAPARLVVSMIAAALCYLGLGRLAERTVGFEAPGLVRQALGQVRSHVVALRSSG